MQWKPVHCGATTAGGTALPACQFDTDHRHFAESNSCGIFIVTAAVDMPSVKRLFTQPR
jgi:hypothetical protein